jgi:hypothetical protein
MSYRAATLTHPGAYWDRSGNVVRDWKTDQALPNYEGQCMVYLDIQGPVLMKTYLRNGERCWESAD